MANPLIIGGVLVATGTGAVGIYVSGNSTIAHVDSITATTSISVVGGATASVAGNQFDPTAVAGTGAIEYQYGDRAVWNALNYQARHANDLDNVAGIHHTLGDGAGQAAPGNHTHVSGDIDLTDTHILVGNGSNVAADVAMSGDATISNTGALTIANDAVTYAKMQNVTATQRALGRNTAGVGDVEEVTVSQLLDWLGSTRGAVLYRGASGWAILAPGTSGYGLTSNGAGADPSYQLASREVLMADGVTPPDPLTLEDQTDWLYEG